LLSVASSRVLQTVVPSKQTGRPGETGIEK
jgi:hypothetical protein